jgi:hypothetical protein
MSVVERYEFLIERSHRDVVCIDPHTGEKYHCPTEVPVDIANHDSGEVVFRIIK